MLSLRKLTWIVVILGVISMGAGYVMSMYLVPTVRPNTAADAASLGGVLWQGWQQRLPELLIKIATIALLSVPAVYLVRCAMGCCKDRELREQMLTADHNDSPVILTAAVLVGLALFVNGLPFTRLPNFVAHLLFRGGFALLLSVLLALILLRGRAHVQSFHQVEEQIRMPGTNGVSILLGVALVTAALLV